MHTFDNGDLLMVKQSKGKIILLLVVIFSIALIFKSKFTYSTENPVQKTTTLKTDSIVIAFSNTPSDDNNEICLIYPGNPFNITRLTNHAGRDCGPLWSPDAKKIAFYVHYDNMNTWSIYVMDADGRNRQRLTDKKEVWDSSPTWSPDDRYIAFSRTYPNENYRSEIWIMNSDGSNFKKLKGINGSGPDWSPDGLKITYYSSQDGNAEIYSMNSDGTNQVRLTNNNADDYWPSWSPDGKSIVFQSNHDGNYEIYVMDSDGSNQKRVTNNPAEDAEPDWSPDGKSIVFSSFRNGKFEIYSINLDGTNLTRLTNLHVHNIQPDCRPVRQNIRINK